MILDRGYLDHWKTNLLRQLTGLPHASELPIRLWEYCEARRDDFVEDRTGHVIAGICRAGIEPKALITALIQCRFIVREAKGFTVHGWRERNHSWLAKIEGGKKTARNAKRNASGQIVAANPAATSKLACNTDTSTPAEAGNTAGAVEWSGVEKSREPADSPPRERGSGGDGRSKASILDETTSRILKLFGSAKKRKLGREAEGELARNAEALPIAEEDWQRLAWWLQLPADESDPYLRDGSRPKDADRLAIRLFTEMERAIAHYKKNGPAEKKETAPEPTGWREAMVAEFPGAEIPADYEEFLKLGASIRRAVLDRLKGGQS